MAFQYINVCTRSVKAFINGIRNYLEFTFSTTYSIQLDKIVVYFCEIIQVENTSIGNQFTLYCLLT